MDDDETPHSPTPSVNEDDPQIQSDEEDGGEADEGEYNGEEAQAGQVEDDDSNIDDAEAPEGQQFDDSDSNIDDAEVQEEQQYEDADVNIDDAGAPEQYQFDDDEDIYAEIDPEDPEVARIIREQEIAELNTELKPDSDIVRYLPKILNATADSAEALARERSRVRGRRNQENFKIAEWFLEKNLINFDGTYQEGEDETQHEDTEGEDEMQHEDSDKCFNCHVGVKRFKLGCFKEHILCAHCFYRTFITLSGNRSKTCSLYIRKINLDNVKEE